MISFFYVTNPPNHNDSGDPLKMEMVYINAFRPINTNAIYPK